LQPFELGFEAVFIGTDALGLGKLLTVCRALIHDLPDLFPCILFHQVDMAGDNKKLPLNPIV
jgi:hypothetical protein